MVACNGGLVLTGLSRTHPFPGGSIPSALMWDKYPWIGDDFDPVGSHVSDWPYISLVIIQAYMGVADIDRGQGGCLLPATHIMVEPDDVTEIEGRGVCLLYTSPSPRDRTRSRMPSSA